MGVPANNVFLYYSQNRLLNLFSHLGYFVVKNWCEVFVFKLSGIPKLLDYL